MTTTLSTNSGVDRQRVVVGHVTTIDIRIMVIHYNLDITISKMSASPNDMPRYRYGKGSREYGRNLGEMKNQDVYVVY
jgi:hypothetical protein